MLAEPITKGGRVYVSHGTGKGLCLLMKWCGMGDHIQSLPIVTALSGLYDVTIYCNPFLFPLYKNLNVTLKPESEILPGFTKENLSKYSEIYSLAEWSIDEEISTEGQPLIDRTSFFGSLFGLFRPRDFSWRDSLGLGERESKDYILLATETGTPQAHIFRSYPQALSLYFLLKESYEVRWVGFPPHKFREMTEDFDSLVSLVDNAKAVLSVDNGIMHLAMSLGVPTFSLFGMSNELTITEPYQYYLPYYEKMTMRSALYNNECSRPCNGHSSNGFGINGKCKHGADCMSELEPSQIARSFSKFIGE